MNDTQLLNRYLPHKSAQRHANTLVVRVDAHELKDVFAALARTLPFMTMFATDEGGTFCMQYVFGLPGEGEPREPLFVVVRSERCIRRARKDTSLYDDVRDRRGRNVLYAVCFRPAG